MNANNNSKMCCCYNIYTSRVIAAASKVYSNDATANTKKEKIFFKIYSGVNKEKLKR